VSHGLPRYVGIDLSEVAVKQAHENLSILARPAFCFQLAAADLIDFSPGQELFDVIVFNEVLYYISVEQAVKQTVRFSGFLQPRGLICISCLGDAKSQAIFRELRPRFEWVSGFFCQESTEFQSQLDARSRHPACQSAVLRPR